MSRTLHSFRARHARQSIGASKIFHHGTQTTSGICRTDPASSCCVACPRPPAAMRAQQSHEARLFVSVAPNDAVLEAGLVLDTQRDERPAAE